MMLFFRKEWLLAIRRFHEVLQPLFFLVMLGMLFPIAIGSDTVLLQKIAPGVIWVAVLLSVLLSSENVYKSDYEDGSLEQLYLSGQSMIAMVFAKLLSQWVIKIVPIFLALPLLCFLYSVSLPIALHIALTLCIGSPSLLLLAMFGSAVTLSVSRGGLILLLVILPLYIPTLIFSLASINAYADGFGNSGHLALLGMMLMVTVTTIPFGIAAVIKASLSAR